MKNILYVEFSSGFGGSSEVLSGLIKCLDKTKFNPIVLICREGPNFDKIKALGVKMVKINLHMIGYNLKPGPISHLKLFLDFLVYLLPNMFRVLVVLWVNKVDLVHINTNIKNNIEGILAAKILRIPCVCHVRGTAKILRRDRFVGQWVDHIIVLNKTALNNVRTAFGEQKCELIHDGIGLEDRYADMDRVRLRNGFGINNEVCVGVLGRLIEGKGQDDFIKAAVIIRKQRSHVKFFIVGSDPDGDNSFEERLKDMVRNAGLDKDIIFTGWRKDKHDIIDALDVLVQSSSTFPEGFGMTCVEAMAFKKVVIATDIPGPSEIVENGVTGFLVPPSDVDKLADAIIRLLDNPILRDRMGEAGRKRVEKLFDIRKCVKQIEFLYEKCFLK